MKTYAWMIFFWICFGYASAQVIPEQLPPATDGQHETETVPDTLDVQKEDRAEMAAERLPARMHEVLKETKYSGWEKGNVFFEKSTDQYILHITGPDGTRTYRFDIEGRPLESDPPARVEGERH